MSGYEPWQVAMVSDLSANGVLGKTSSLLPKLRDDGSNWVVYKERMWDLLVEQDCRCHLMGRVKPPTVPKIDEKTSEADKEKLTEAYEVEMDEYSKKESTIRTQQIRAGGDRGEWAMAQNSKQGRGAEQSFQAGVEEPRRSGGGQLVRRNEGQTRPPRG